MRTTVFGVFLSAAFFYGCASYHNHKTDVEAQEVNVQPHFPEPTTKTQKIAAYLRDHGEDGQRGAQCLGFYTRNGPLSICYIDLNRPFTYSDDIFYFSFESFDHTCIDVGLDDTLDDVVIDETQTPIPVKDTKPDFQRFVQREYNFVIRNVYRALPW